MILGHTYAVPIWECEISSCIIGDFVLFTDGGAIEHLGADLQLQVVLHPSPSP